MLVDLLEALELATFESFKFANFLKLTSRLKTRATNKAKQWNASIACAVTHRGRKAIAALTFETFHFHASVHFSML